MRNLDLKKFEFQIKDKKKIIHKLNFINLFISRNLKLSILFLSFLVTFCFQKKLFSEAESIKFVPKENNFIFSYWYCIENNQSPLVH